MAVKSSSTVSVSWIWRQSSSRRQRTTSCPSAASHFWTKIITGAIECCCPEDWGQWWDFLVCWSQVEDSGTAGSNLSFRFHEEAGDITSRVCRSWGSYKLVWSRCGRIETSLLLPLWWKPCRTFPLSSPVLRWSSLTHQGRTRSRWRRHLDSGANASFWRAAGPEVNWDRGPCTRWPCLGSRLPRTFVSSIGVLRLSPAACHWQ